MKNLVFFVTLTFVIQSSAKTKTYYVADHLADCVGVAPQKCMLIREKQTDPWSNFYGTIEGFTYEEGFEYLIKVKETKIKNPPADGSSLKYTLIEILRKRKTEEELTLYNDWKVTSLKGIVSFQRNPTININKEEGKVSGFAGCNNFFGTFEPGTSTFDFAQIGMSRIGMTRKMCPDMTVENAFTNSLNEISYYKIENEILSFYDRNNTVLMTCVLNEK
jgi:heat shock protein HslJ